MEQKIIDTANKYKELALMLEDFELEQAIDEDAPEEVQTALLKLYYTKAFDVEIEKCEDLLEEDTDEETVNAVAEAAFTVDKAAESARSAIEDYYSEDKEFAERVDSITAGTEAEEIFVKLIKLYKCEEIIKEAQSCSMKFPLYGSAASPDFRREDNGIAGDAERETAQKQGIDMSEIYELRQQLIKEIGSIIERKAEVL